MNIREATDQIRGAVRAYLSRDEHGLWLVPSEMQRPIILMGPPGIGKTAIAHQVADELGINFVSYSITHHTRQSALGLPYIAEATFGGRQQRVSRYTMSEIIAAVYDAIEESGVSEGMLFLDEINCASETLAPAMLQFLQYKTFGQHRLPEGWVIVCAGNPPEYNRAAREFDPAMMDRLKRVDVEPDLEVWLDYAAAHGVHPAITSYLAGKPASFYRVRPSGGAMRIVTARGWEDLSRMMVAYRREGLAVDRTLVAQYVQDRETSEDFALYFELFAKYEDDYRVSEILAGSVAPEIVGRAREASFDERVAVVNLLLAAVAADVHDQEAAEQGLRLVRDDLLAWKGGEADMAALDQLLAEARSQADEARSRGQASRARQLALARRAELLGTLREEAARADLAGGAVFDAAKQAFNAAVHQTAEACAQAAERLDHALSFLDEAFGDGQEMVLFCSHVAQDAIAMRFVADHGPASFAEHARSLMLEERGLDLLSQVDALLEV